MTFPSKGSCRRIRRMASYILRVFVDEESGSFKKILNGNREKFVLIGHGIFSEHGGFSQPSCLQFLVWREW